jgi:hypothetical protein
MSQKLTKADGDAAFEEGLRQENVSYNLATPMYLKAIAIYLKLLLEKK